MDSGTPEVLLREEIEAKSRLYTDFAQSATHGQIRLVDPRHVTMHLRRPSAVLQAIQDLLER